MSARVVDVEDDLVTLRFLGTLQYDELQALYNAVDVVIRDKEEIRVLVLAQDFGGWARDGDWGDVSFQARFDEHIKKMAIVGEQDWEELTLLFAAKWLRPFPIEYFLPKDIRKAREWLAEAT